MPVNKQLRWEYLTLNPEDELEKHLSGETWDKVRDAWGYSTPPYGSEVVHHIWRGGIGYKCDIMSLLITVSPAAHNYVHKCSKHGVVACVYTKMLKEEFDPDEVKDATGLNLLALLTIWKDNEEVIHPYYVGLITEIENGIVRDSDNPTS